MTRFGWIMTTWLRGAPRRACPTLLRPVPKLIWNASASVPIGLYCGASSRHPSRRRACSWSARRRPRGLSRQARLSGDGRTAPKACPRPSRSNGLPHRSHDHRRRSGRGSCARPRSARANPAQLAGLPDRRGRRGLPDELAVRRTPSTAAISARFPRRPSSAGPILSGPSRTTDHAQVSSRTDTRRRKLSGPRPPPFRPYRCRSLPTRMPPEDHVATLPVQFDGGRAARRHHCRPCRSHSQPILAVSLSRRIRIAGFVDEASQRFAIPASWIRAVMQAESLGDARALSPKGAMGLMQIMPDTWAELRRRYGLGADPYDPHDNIMAGAAYLRELHDRYGEHGFLAAYNAGPGRYEDHLATGRPLPSETLAYVAAVASLIGAGTDDRSYVAAAMASSWTSAPLFVARSATGSMLSRPVIRCADAARSSLTKRRKVGQRLRRSPMGCSPRCRVGMNGHDLDRPVSLSSGLWRTFESSAKSCRGTQPTDGKGKAPPPDRAHMVGGLEFHGPCRDRAGWRFNSKPERIQRLDAPSPPQATSRRAMTGRDEDFHVRPGPHPARQTRRQAAKDLCRRGDARREEGWPYRAELRPQVGPARAARDSGGAGAPHSRCRCARPRGGS